MPLKFNENEKHFQAQKSYVVTHKVPGSRHLRVSPLDQPKQPVYWAIADFSSGNTNSPLVTVHTSSEKGPIVAAAGVKKSSEFSTQNANFKIFTGDPSSNLWNLDEGYPVAGINAMGRIAVTYAFPVRDSGQVYAWRRVIHREIVVSTSSGISDSSNEATGADDWKLVSLPVNSEKGYASDYTTVDFWEAGGEHEHIIGVYVTETSSVPFRSGHPHIHWFENLGNEEEARALAVILSLSQSQQAGLNIVALGTGLMANNIMIGM